MYFNRVSIWSVLSRMASGWTFGTSEVSARSDPIGGIILRTQMSWWGSDARLSKFRILCMWWRNSSPLQIYVTDSSDTKRFEEARLVSSTFSLCAGVTQLHHKKFRFWNEPGAALQCVCVWGIVFPAEFDRVAGGGNACQSAVTGLCQQARSDDGGSSVGAGRNSQSARDPGSSVAGPGLLRRQCWGAAGNRSKLESSS